MLRYEPELLRLRPTICGAIVKIGAEYRGIKVTEGRRRKAISENVIVFVIVKRQRE